MFFFCLFFTKVFRDRETPDWTTVGSAAKTSERWSASHSFVTASSQSVTCVLSQIHCSAHHLHLINTFPQVTMKTFNQDVQDQRESQHDISLKGCSHLEFHFSLNFNLNVMCQYLARLTPWKRKDCLKVKREAAVDLDPHIDWGGLQCRANHWWHANVKQG